LTQVDLFAWLGNEMLIFGGHVVKGYTTPKL